MVVLGDDLRLVKITKVVGVGRNFIKFGVETLGSASKDEIPVQRIIISFSQDGFHLTHSQRFKRYFLCWFLTSMRDIVDVERVWDESEVMAQDDFFFFFFFWGGAHNAMQLTWLAHEHQLNFGRGVSPLQCKVHRWGNTFMYEYRW
jgi:hypothetical protein